MKLTYEEVVQLKNALLKAQHFDFAAKFREEEKRLFALMSKKRRQEITRQKEMEKALIMSEWANVKVSFPIGKWTLKPYQKFVAKKKKKATPVKKKKSKSRTTR